MSPKEKNILRTRKIWLLAKVILNINIVFWLIETLFFIIKDGFHWSSETKSEMICDTIVSYGYYAFCVLFAIVIINVIEYLLSYDND